MAGFKKATPKREYMKLGMYGRTGSGKTLTALMIAEMLAKLEGKRIAYIDTEKSTAFYVRDVPERTVHPAAFDIDILETKSIFEALEAIESLDTSQHGVFVIDSMTAIWEAAKATYSGKLTSKGGIPIQAWSQIKKPYKKLMSLFLDLPAHAIICGREGVEMSKDDDGELEVIGARFKAEGETAFEPHILVQMTPEREENGTHKIRAFFEKDRSGLLTGKTIDWPTAETFLPAVRLLVGSEASARLGTAEENAQRDAESAERRIEAEDAERAALAEQIRSAIVQAPSLVSLKSAWELTKGKKAKLGEAFEQLETLKDVRKSELIQAAA